MADAAEVRPAPRVSLSLLLPRDAASIPVVRHLCQFALEELGCVSDCVDAVGLAVTEACANVVQHAGDGEAYTVEVEVSSDTCEMRVVNSGGGFLMTDADASIRDRARDAMSESGRGLEIIRAMTDHLWFESQPESGTLLRMVKVLEFEEEAPARRLMISPPTDDGG